MGTGTGFSWLDLGATWNFATQNAGNTSSSGSAGDIGDGEGSFGGVGGVGGSEVEVSPYDMGILTDYSLLEGDGPNLIF